MKERLSQLLNSLGFTATRLADEINVQRSGISHILSGRNQPSFDFLVRLLNRFPDINAEWLLLGKGKMFNKDDKSNPNVKLYDTEPELINDKSSLLRSEPQAKYGKVTNVTINKIVLLNSDGTFEIYRQQD